MGLPIWSDLDRAVNDPTKIDEAIAAAVAAHNEDAESHLGADQALETHRENPVIDHPAESVPNDKIKPLARAYVAIVDPSSEFDYDSVDSAWAYAESIGGGNILVTPGNHYLGSILHVDGTINLIGTDPDTCIVIADESNNFYFETGYWPSGWSGSFEFSNLTLRSTSPGFFIPKSGIDLERSMLLVRNCIFDGAGGYCLEAVYRPIFETSKIILSSTAAVSSREGAVLRDVELDTVASSGVIRFIDPTADFELQHWTLDGVRTSNFLSWASGVRLDLAGDALFIWSSFKDCEFRSLDSQTIYFDSGALIACTILPHSGENLVFDLNAGAALGCYLYGGSAGDVYASGTYVGCAMDVDPDYVSPLARVVAPAALANFRTASSMQTFFDFRSANTWLKTPTSTQSYTADVPQAGERRTMIILTSGTTPYTITFSTGFKTTGTLSTGSTSARRFIIEFISDGTYLIETSRTTAIA